MLMHILLDEKTNNIIILEFQKIKGSKRSLHQSPGQGLQVSLIHVLFKPHKLRKFAKMSWGLLCQAHEKENGYRFFVCSFQILFKCPLSQRVHQKTIEHWLEHIMLGEFLLECCQGFFNASVVGISWTLSFSQAKSICLNHRKC